jgi:hypothetical protein
MRARKTYLHTLGELSATQGKAFALCPGQNMLTLGSVALQSLVAQRRLGRTAFSSIGQLCMDQLISLRHRGAFSTVAQTFSQCCEEVRQSSDASIRDLLAEWYQVRRSMSTSRAVLLTIAPGCVVSDKRTSRSSHTQIGWPSCSNVCPTQFFGTPKLFNGDSGSDKNRTSYVPCRQCQWHGRNKATPSPRIELSKGNNDKLQVLDRRCSPLGTDADPGLQVLVLGDLGDPELWIDAVASMHKSSGHLDGSCIWDS